MPKPKYTLNVDGQEHLVSVDNIQKHGIESYAEAYPNATIRMRDKDNKDYDVDLGYYNRATELGLRPFKTDTYDPGEKNAPKNVQDQWIKMGLNPDGTKKQNTDNNKYSLQEKPSGGFISQKLAQNNKSNIQPYSTQWSEKDSNPQDPSPWNDKSIIPTNGFMTQKLSQTRRQNIVPENQWMKNPDYADYAVERMQQSQDPGNWKGIPERMPQSKQEQAVETQKKLNELYNNISLPIFERTLNKAIKEGNKAAAPFNNALHNNQGLFAGAAGQAVQGLNQEAEKRKNQKIDPNRVISETIKDIQTKLGSSKDHSNSKTNDSFYNDFINYTVEQLQQKYINQNVPKSTLDYILRKTLTESTLGQLIDMQSGQTLSQRQYEAQGLQNYHPNTQEKIAGEVLKIGADLPLMAATGGLGANVAKKVAQTGAKELIDAGLSKMAAQGVVSRAAQQTGMKYAIGAASGATNFGALQGIGSAVGQQYQNGKINIRKVLENTTNGIVTGAVLGPVGIANEKLTGVLKDTFGTTAGKVGGYATSLGGRTTVLAGSSIIGQLTQNPDMKLEDIDLTSEFAHAGLMNIGFDMIGAAKRISNAKNDPLKGISIDDLNLSQDDIKILNKAGFVGNNARDIAESFTREIYDRKISRNHESGALSDAEYERLKKEHDLNNAGENMASFLTNPDIPLSTKSKMAYLMTGGVYKLAPNTNVGNVEQLEDGTFMVSKFNPSGQSNEIHIFKTAQEAEKYRYSAQNEVKPNQVRALEDVMTKAGKIASANRIFDMIANQYGISKDEAVSIYASGRKGKLNDDKSKSVYTTIDNLLSSVKEIDDYHYNPKELRKRINEGYEKENGWIEKVLTKKYNDLSGEEKKAYDEYIENMQLILQGNKNNAKIGEESDPEKGNESNDIASADKQLQYLEKGLVPYTAEPDVDVQQQQTPALVPIGTERGQAAYEEHDPVNMRNIIVHHDVARQRLESAVPEHIATALENGQEESVQSDIDNLNDDQIRIIDDYKEKRDAANGLSQSFDNAHIADIQANNESVDNMDMVQGMVAIVPLGRYGDAEHQYGIIRSGMTSQDIYDDPDMALVVTPIKSNKDGSLDFASTSDPITMTNKDNSPVTYLNPQDIKDSLNAPFEAEKSVLKGQPIAPGETFQISDETGSNMSEVNILGQNPDGTWDVQETGQKTPVTISEEELIGLKENAERIPFLQQYEKEDAEIQNEIKKSEIAIKREEEKKRKIEAEAERKAAEDEEKARIAEEQKKPINRLLKYPEGHKKAGKPDYENSNPLDVKDYLVQSLGFADALKSVKNMRSSIDSKIAEKEKSLSDIELEISNSSLDPDEAISAKEYIDNFKNEIIYLKKSALFWKNMDEMIGGKSSEEIQSAIDKKIKAREEYKKRIEREKNTYPKIEPEDEYMANSEMAMEILNNTEPQNIEELAASMLGKDIFLIPGGEHGAKAETGYGNSEMRSILSIYRTKEKGGMTISKAGEMVDLAAREGYPDIVFESGLDKDNTGNTGRNAILSVLGQARTYADIRDYIKNNRLSQARIVVEAEKRDEQEAKESYCQEAYHMSAEEYDSYIENNIVITEEKYKDFDESEYYSKFGEELHKSEEYDTTGKDTATSGSNQILQGTQSVLPEGSTESGNEGTTVSPRMRSDTTEGTLSESPSGGEQEVKEKPTIEQLIATARGDESLPETIQAREELSQIGIDWNEKGTIEDANANRMNIIEQRLADIDDHKFEIQDNIDSLGDNPNPLELAALISEKSILENEQNDLEAEYTGLKQLKNISDAESEVDTNPSNAQAEAGNYKKGHVSIDGHDITIENPKGSIRSGVDSDGEKWETTMANTYGYILGTKGIDGEHIDVFLSDDPSNGNVFVVDQINPKTGEFDEHKVMYGFNSMEEAKQAYLSNYSKGCKGLGDITEVSKEDFKKWIDSSTRKTKPFSEYKIAKKEESLTPTEEQKGLGNTTEENKEVFKSITVKKIKEIDGDDIISSKKVASFYKEFYSQYGDLTPEYKKYRDDVINAYNEYYAEVENTIKKSIKTGELESQIREASEEKLKSNIEALKRDHLTIDEYINYYLGKALAGIYYTPKINAPLERTIVNDHANLDVRKKYLIPLFEKELARRQLNAINEIKISTQNSNTSPYEPISQAGKEKAKSIDAEIESQRKIVSQANKDVEKARNEISNRNGLFGDTKPVELFNNTSDFSSDNLHKALGKYIKAAELEQNKLNELISSRDKKLMDIDKAELSQGDIFDADQKKDSEEIVETAEKVVKEQSRVKPKDGNISTGNVFHDTGEKIGAARKDTSTQRGKKSNDEMGKMPSWRKKYNITNITQDKINNGEENGPFYITCEFKYNRHTLNRYVRDKNGEPITFDSVDEAENFIPVVEVDAQHFKVREDKSDGRFHIVRQTSSGRYIDYIDFETKEEALTYMASKEGSMSLLNHKRENYDIPGKENITRNGKDWKHGNHIKSTEEFRKKFAFRGVEFGNWENQDERQQFIDMTYDALCDLSDALGISPEALSLGGELSIAFGARGTKGASAHYEPSRIVINLTKEHGTGSLAHEWFHALDNYFGRLDAGQSAERGEDGTTDQSTWHSYASSEIWGRKGIRKEMKDAFHNLISTITKKNVEHITSVEDAQKAVDDIKYLLKKTAFSPIDKWENMGMYEKIQRGITSWKYNRKTKEREDVHIAPTTGQLERIKELLESIVEHKDPNTHREFDMAKGGWYIDGEDARELNTILSEVFPKGSDLSTIKQGKFGNNIIYYYGRLLPAEEKLNKAKNSESETMSVDTDFKKNSEKYDLSRAMPYWSTELEMGARAFETFILDRLVSMGLNNDYLTYDKEIVYKTMFGISPYPEGSERENINAAFDKLFDVMKEKVEDGKNILYDPNADYNKNDIFAKNSTNEKKSSYKTQKGKEIKYETLSLFPDEAFDAGRGSDNLQREEDLSGNKLRRLEEGEICAVERVFTESKAFSFSGKERIESVEDVAYIFDQLETTANENVFLVLTKNGKPVIAHVGMGSVNQSKVDTLAIRAAVDAYAPDKIYFVHNHPSGRVIASRDDINTLDGIREMLDDPSILQDGIIIDTKRGVYGTFGLSGVNENKKDATESGTYPIKMFTFDTLVFSKDFIPDAQPFRSASDIASFISSQRLGDRKKMSYLILDQSNTVVGNLHIPYTDTLSHEEDIAKEMAVNATKFGGSVVVLYGSFDLNRSSLEKTNDFLRTKSASNIRMLDVLHIDGINQYESAINNGVLEKGEKYNSINKAENSPAMVKERPLELSDEEKSIIDKSKKDNTYMKAPNGKPSKLSPRQWVQVRTKVFKDWFGDWELGHKTINIVKTGIEHGFKNFEEARDWAKKNISRTLSNDETNGKGNIRISNTAIDKFISESSITKSDSKDIHLAVLKILPDVIRESIDAEQHPDYLKGEDGVRRPENGKNKDVTIHRLYGAVDIDGKIHRVKVTLKENTHTGETPKAYSYEATKIELLAGQHGDVSSTSPRNSNNSILIANLLNGVDKSYEKGKKLLDYSKVLDENGEPMEVYHGSKKSGIHIFNPSTWFSTKEQHSKVYEAKKKWYQIFNKEPLYKTYLNVRNPLFLGNIDLHRDDNAAYISEMSGIPKDEIGKAITESFTEKEKLYFENEDSKKYKYSGPTWTYTNLKQLHQLLKKYGYDGLNAIEHIVVKPFVEVYEVTTFAAFEPNQIKSATDNNGEFSPSNDDIKFSIRRKDPPKNTGIGYKVFYLKNGKLYPPMVANPDGKETPVGVWLDADEGIRAGVSKTGRPKVKQGGPGTQGGSGTLAYRPGWHLGYIPYAIQFNRLNPVTGERELFPKDFVWAEVEYAKDKDYQDEAMGYGYNQNGNFQHSLAGLPRIPEDGYYRYRTNPNPKTDEWIITGAMKVNKILTPEEVDKIVINSGREPQKREQGNNIITADLQKINNYLSLQNDHVVERVEETGLLKSHLERMRNLAINAPETLIAMETRDVVNSLPETMNAINVAKIIQAANSKNVLAMYVPWTKQIILLTDHGTIKELRDANWHENFHYAIDMSIPKGTESKEMMRRAAFAASFLDPDLSKWIEENYPENARDEEMVVHTLEGVVSWMEDNGKINTLKSGLDFGDDDLNEITNKIIKFLTNNENGKDKSNREDAGRDSEGKSAEDKQWENESFVPTLSESQRGESEGREKISLYPEEEDIRLSKKDKPRKKEGESLINFNRRLKEWQQENENAMKDRSIENDDSQKINSELGDLSMELMSHPSPTRKPGETDEDYNVRFDKWSEWHHTRGREIYDRLSELKRQAEVLKSEERSNEMKSSDEHLYDGTVPDQKIDDNVNTFSDEDMRDIRQTFAKKMNNLKIVLSKSQIKQDIKNEIIERRRYIESSNLEDVFFVDKIKDLAGRGNEGKQILKDIPSYLEGTYTGEVSDKLKEISKLVADWFEEIYNLLASEGVLYNAPKIQNYVTHIWDWSRSSKDAQEKYMNWINALRLRSPYTRHRVIPSYAEGIAMGMVPKYEDITGIILNYGHYATETIANHRLVEFVRNFKLRMEGGKDNMPADMDIIVSDSVKDPIYSRMDNNALEGYKVLNPIRPILAPVFGDQRILDPKNLNKLTNKLVDGIWVISGTMKKVKLSFSFFHHYALTEAALNYAMPWKAAKILAKNIIWDTITKNKIPALVDKDAAKEAVEHLVKLGASSDYAAAEVNGFTGYLVKFTQDKNIQGAKQFAELLNFLNTGSDKILWDILHDGYKIYCFKQMADERKKEAKRKGWSEEQLYKALDEVGQLTNDTFGGLHFDILGLSPKSVRILRALLLSPDWLLSTMRHALAPFGFGQLYNGEGFWKRINSKEPSAISRKKYGRQFWITAAIFYYSFMQALQVYFRSKDEEDENKKAEEMRKIDPSYKSPYELAYPDGMKWYDYTMLGNAQEQQTHLFTGHYQDGTESYARWGKQLRELPELFFGRYGFSFPGPMVEKMSGKINPLLGSAFTLMTGYTLSGFADKDMKDKRGVERDVSRLYMLAKQFIPFSVPTQEDKEFMTLDLIMPSSKGFSASKAIYYFEQAIKSGDIDLVNKVYSSCVLNGLKPDKYLNVAKAKIEAEAKKNTLEGIENLDDATKAFDKSKDLKDKKRLMRYMEQQFGSQDYEDISKADIVEQAKGIINGDEPDMTNSDNYIMNSNSLDISEDHRMKKNIAGLKKYYQDYINMVSTNPSTAARLRLQKRKYIEGYMISSKYRSAIGRMKKALGKGNDAEVMQNIRKTRKAYFDTMNGM